MTSTSTESREKCEAPSSTSGDIPNAGTACVLSPSSGGRPEASADPLRKFYDEPFRAAEVAEPIAVFVGLDLANQLPAVGSQTGDGGVDVVDCECEMAEARGVRRRVRRRPAGGTISRRAAPPVSGR